MTRTAWRSTSRRASGLSGDDVDRMVREAAVYTEQDRARQDFIALRNEADALLYQALRVARDVVEGVPQEQHEKLDAGISALKLALLTGDVAQIRERMERLRRVSDTVRVIAGAPIPLESASEDVTVRALG